MSLLVTLSSTTCFGAPLDSFKADLVDKTEAKNAVKAAEAAKDNADVPPDLRAPRVDANMELLRRMILEGIEKGTLTKGESTETRHNLERIERLEATYKLSGAKLSAGERRQLHQQENELHELLWKKTHNGLKPSEPLNK